MNVTQTARPRNVKSTFHQAFLTVLRCFHIHWSFCPQILWIRCYDLWLIGKKSEVQRILATCVRINNYWFVVWIRNWRLTFSFKTFSRWTQQTQGMGQLNYSYLCYYIQLPKELLCSKRLPLYTFSSFKARTEFPKGKGIRELPERIMKSIKNRCKRVLENYNLQCQNAGTLPSTNARHTVPATTC